MTTRFPKQFSLLTVRVPGIKDFVPQPAHDEKTAEERRNNPSGTLLLERQYIGAVIAKNFFEKLLDKPADEVRFGTRMIAAAALGSARYSFEDNGLISFRRVRLPMLFDIEKGRRLTEPERIARTEVALERMVSGSEHLYYDMKSNEPRKVADTLGAFGREAGEAALWVALQSVPEVAQSSSILQVQRSVLRVAMGAFDTSMKLASELGTNPSLAMLAERDTDWTKHLSLSLHHGAFAAFAEAQYDAKATTPMA